MIAISMAVQHYTRLLIAFCHVISAHNIIKKYEITVTQNAITYICVVYIFRYLSCRIEGAYG